MVARLVDSRWLLLMWMRRDFAVRYRQSLLGVAWTLVQPLFLLLVYGVVFTRVLDVSTPSVPYVAFVFCGLAPWAFVASSLAVGIASVLTAQPIVTKVWFPREVVPLAAVGVGLLDLAISSAVMLAVCGVLVGVHWTWVLLPLAYVGLVLAVAGVVTFGACLTVFVRDLRQAVPLALQLAFIATPVMYPPGLVPARLHWLVDANPVAVTIGNVRALVLDGAVPDLTRLLVPVGVGAGLLVLALAYVRAVEGRFADVL